MMEEFQVDSASKTNQIQLESRVVYGVAKQVWPMILNCIREKGPKYLKSTSIWAWEDLS